MSASEISRQTGDASWSGGATTSERAAGLGGPVSPPARTTPGPCRTCGHHGPRVVLCLDPDCRHGVVFHKIRGNGSRGACDVTGAGGKRCQCQAPVITEFNANGDPST